VLSGTGRMGSALFPIVLHGISEIGLLFPYLFIGVLTLITGILSLYLVTETKDLNLDEEYKKE